MVTPTGRSCRAALLGGLSLVFIACGVLAAGPARGQSTPVYAKQSRRAYIRSALAALQESTDEELNDILNYIYVMRGNRCQAPSHSMTVDCMLAVARRSCSQKPDEGREACHRVSDVIVTNRLSEEQFLPRRARYELRKQKGPYRYALFRELRRRYATLVTEMAMSQWQTGDLTDLDALAGGIDGYCLAVSASRDLSWQHCTSAIVWFVGTSGRGLETQP